MKNRLIIHPCKTGFLVEAVSTVPSAAPPSLVHGQYHDLHAVADVKGLLDLIKETYEPPSIVQCETRERQ